MIPKEITCDLKNGLSLEETLIKHHTNLKELFSVDYSPKLTDDWTYIQPTKWNSFRVSKSINGKRQEFGTYKSHAEALIVRNKLIECNWDKSQLPIIYEKCGIRPPKPGR